LSLALALLTPGVVLAADTDATFHTSKGDFTFHLEFADTPAQQEQGLMYRTSLAPNVGMLFDFRDEEVVAFWMKNTLIPLDMLFIGADGTIKTIHADARPGDLTPISSVAPVRFVLEIAGGRAAEIGLEPGDVMQQARVQKP
jgi:uncharacterized membrane protein (UPF0127 family)